MNPGVTLKEKSSKRVSSIVSPSCGMENLSCKSKSVESTAKCDLEPKVKRKCTEDMPSGYKKIDDGGFVILPRQRMEDMCKKTKCSSCGASGTLAIMPENFVKQNSFITVSYISRTTSYVNDGILVICSRLDCGKIMYRYNAKDCDAPSSQKIPKLVSVGQKSSAAAVPEDISTSASKDKLTDTPKGISSIVPKSCATNVTSGDVSAVPKVASTVPSVSVNANFKSNKESASQPDTIACVMSPSCSVASVQTNVATLSKTVVTACPQVKVTVASSLSSTALIHTTSSVSVPQTFTSPNTENISPLNAENVQLIVQKRKADFSQTIQNISDPNEKPQRITVASSQEGILAVAQKSNVTGDQSQGAVAASQADAAPIQQKAEKSHSQEASQSLEQKSTVIPPEFTWNSCQREATGLQENTAASLPVHAFTFQIPGSGVVPKTDVILPKCIEIPDEKISVLDYRTKSFLVIKENCFVPTIKSQMSESKVFDNSAGKDKVFDNSAGKDKVFDNSAAKDKVFDNSAGKDKVFDDSAGKDKVFDNSANKDKMFDNSTSKDKLCNPVPMIVLPKEDTSHWLKKKNYIKIEKDQHISRTIAEIKVENVDDLELEETQAEEGSSMKVTNSQEKNCGSVMTADKKQDPSVAKTEVRLKGKRQRKKYFGDSAEETGLAKKHIKIEVSDEQSVDTYLNKIIVHDGISAIKREEKEKFYSSHSSVEENEPDELIVNGLSVEETIREETILTDCFL